MTYMYEHCLSMVNCPELAEQHLPQSVPQRTDSYAAPPITDPPVTGVHCLGGLTITWSVNSSSARLAWRCAGKNDKGVRDQCYLRDRD